jgi:hypothetical protein
VEFLSTRRRVRGLRLKFEESLSRREGFDMSTKHEGEKEWKIGY